MSNPSLGSLPAQKLCFSLQCLSCIKGHWRLSSIKGYLLLKVVFHQKSSSIRSRFPPKAVLHFGHLPSTVVFHWRLSSTESCVSLKIVFHRRSCSTEGCLLPKVVFHRRLSSTKSRLPPKVIFHRRSSSTEGRLPPTKTPWLILYLWEQSAYQISASYLA